MNSNLCNNCGGEYEYRHGRWICRACGAYRQEEISNEEVTLLYTAFQKLRLAEFSEAEQEFEDVMMKYPENPNGYWGHLMSRYGIKYEEDFDGKMIPTCYAASIQSVLSDGDYQQTLRYANEESKAYYRQQAEYIERVRLTWIEKAKKEKPYDIFICYKDSDLANGVSRTQDSVVAQEIYMHLLEQGYRVFFSRESLRDKTGEKYEPYIYSALSTAKVMLVYGSSASYINSTWLKNEWHRFSKRIAAGEKHPEALLVACDGFSPSELPFALASRQCFDANRKTFFGDLDRCIERIMGESKQAEVLPPKEEKLLSGLHEHSYKKKIVKPTCVAKGYTLHYCDCGYEYKDAYTPLTDHKFKTVSRTEPTCKTDGKEEKICEVCGERQIKTLPALGHQFSKWVESKHATCTENGEEQRKCLRCGETETKVIPKTGHSFEEWIAESDGTYKSYCKNCGETKTKATKPDLSTPNARETKNNRLTVVFASLLILLIAGAVIWFFVYSNSVEHDFRFAKLPDGTYEISKVKVIPSDGKLEIPSTYRDVPVTSIGDGFIGDANKMLTSVVIPDGITRIGKEAFRDCDGLTHITIPDSVQVIGEGAFYNCKGLTDIVIPDSVTTIEKMAFYLCQGAQSIALGNGVTTIGDGAFAHITFLTSVSIPDSVTVIGNGAFEGCRNLSSVTLGNSVETIGANAFGTCDGITEIVIPDSVVTIGDSAFRGCTRLTSIVIPEGVTAIGASPFCSCYSLEEIIVAQGNPDYIAIDGNLYSKDGRVFIQYAGAKTASSFVIPDGVITIGDGAFLSCYELESVVIPDSVTEIEDHAFQFCNLTSIELPDSVTKIGQGAFCGCDFTEITIPSGVTKIGYDVFGSCENLQTVRFKGTESEWNNIDGKAYIPSGVELIFDAQ